MIQWYSNCFFFKKHKKSSSGWNTTIFELHKFTRHVSRFKHFCYLTLGLSPPVASLGGRSVCHHFRLTPFYNVFVMKTFCFNLIGLNPHTQRKPTEFLAKNFSLFLVFACFWTKNSMNFWRRPFFYFLAFTNFSSRGAASSRCVTHTE